MKEKDILALPLGTRDRYILALRRLHRGEQFWSEPVCEACGEVFELRFSTAEIGLDNLPEALPEPSEVELEEGILRLRPVSLADLLAVERVTDPETAVCMLGARVIGDEEAETLSVDVLGKVLETLDPMADIWLHCTCPECGAEHSIAFDPVHFTAREIRQMARHILQDVVDIARAFHWSEREILRLPDERRAYYVAEALA